MKASKIGKENAVIELSRDEVLAINNALNEVLHGGALDEWDFSTRMGVERAEAKKLLDEINLLLDSMARL